MAWVDAIGKNVRMGYRYSVGEARIDYDPAGLSVRIDVASIVGDADARSKGVRQANWFDGSGSFLVHSIERVGLGELFFGGGWEPASLRYRDCTEAFHRQRPLIEHAAPCASAICQGDLDLVRKAVADWRAELGPGAVAYDEERAPDGDDVLELLEWLEYWFERSLRTCEVPIFHYG